MAKKIKKENIEKVTGIGIIKIQLSLSGNTPDANTGGQMLVYNESRSLEYEGDTTPEIKKLLDGRPKAYFIGYLNEKKQLVVGKEVVDPGW